jgi:hypothetical protein
LDAVCKRKLLSVQFGLQFFKRGVMLLDSLICDLLTCEEGKKNMLYILVLVQPSIQIFIPIYSNILKEKNKSLKG